MAKSVGQDELRKMMQKVKAAKPSSSSNSTRLKKYKLSARELQVLAKGMLKFDSLQILSYFS